MEKDGSKKVETTDYHMNVRKKHNFFRTSVDTLEAAYLRTIIILLIYLKSERLAYRNVSSYKKSVTS